MGIIIKNHATELLYVLHLRRKNFGPMIIIQQAIILFQYLFRFCQLIPNKGSGAGKFLILERETILSLNRLEEYFIFNIDYIINIIYKRLNDYDHGMEI